MDEQDEVGKLQRQAREDRKLFQRAERALAEVDRAQGLTEEQADVLAALRIRIEGKERASLDELLSATGNITGKRDLGEVLTGGTDVESSGWPEVKEKKLDWPGQSG